jgi:hypothetical protein
MRTRIVNQLHVAALNEEVRRKKAPWRPTGRTAERASLNKKTPVIRSRNSSRSASVARNFKNVMSITTTCVLRHCQSFSLD